jgi:alkanesulfonate monooxygenase SsuD/methylene tetrahydromethanopterin reductase-like flavin-dependent oxidoreductase (luciferase family)
VRRWGRTFPRSPRELLIGGPADIAFRRAARHGQGWIMAGGPTSVFSEGREKLDAAFRAAGRAERPRALAGGFFALGEDAEAEARRGLGAYFAADPELAEPIIAGALTDAAAIRKTLEEFERRGCEDFLLFPASADPAQVDLLAAAVG